MMHHQGPILAAAGLIATIALLVSHGVSYMLPGPAAGQPIPAVLIGAGDISVCGSDGDDRTANLVTRLIKENPQAVIFTAGDNAQIAGEPYEFADCFNPSWGRFKERIHPSPGNHDWITLYGKAYFDYFGPAAGEYGKGYYSYDLGGWHIVSLNTNCGADHCSPASPQAQWLRADLEQNQLRCTLLYWHEPLIDSGKVDTTTAGLAFWDIASQFGAEVVVNGHDHHYERFAPLDRYGKVDPASGIRTFIVGTGGAWLFELDQPLAITEARDNTSLGVIMFTLFPDRYDWRFVPEKDEGYADGGTGACH